MVLADSFSKTLIISHTYPKPRCSSVNPGIVELGHYLVTNEHMIYHWLSKKLVYNDTINVLFCSPWMDIYYAYYRFHKPATRRALKRISLTGLLSH